MNESINPGMVRRDLRAVQDKYKDWITLTETVNVHAMARDSADAIEWLQEHLKNFYWVPVSERLPKAPEQDWVLVKTHTVPDGNPGMPHMAELRNGVWYCDCCDGPMEETLAILVDAWFDTELLKDTPTGIRLEPVIKKK